MYLGESHLIDRLSFMLCKYFNVDIFICFEERQCLPVS